MANPRPQGTCIFCGGFGLSKEHLFSDWLRELFPRTRDDKHALARLISWAPRPTFHQSVKQGHSGSRKIRKVCGRCNSGWVSLIDGAAKKIAIPLINGAAVELTREDCRALAAWFAKLAMVADAMDIRTMVVPQADRDWMRQQSLPPIRWEVWIGFYEGSEWRELAMQHHSGILNFAAIGDPEALSGYVNSATFGLGNLLAHVIGSEDFEIDLGTGARIMRRIWPAIDPLTWPLPHSITDDEAGAIARSLREAYLSSREAAHQAANQAIT